MESLLLCLALPERLTVQGVSVWLAPCPPPVWLHCLTGPGSPRLMPEGELDWRGPRRAIRQTAEPGCSVRGRPAGAGALEPGCGVPWGPAAARACRSPGGGDRCPCAGGRGGGVGGARAAWTAACNPCNPGCWGGRAAGRVSRTYLGRVCEPAAVPPCRVLVEAFWHCFWCVLRKALMSARCALLL